MPQPELVVADQGAWRVWLAENAEQSDGVWLVLARKGSAAPTSLTYPQALEEALCQGWIDGQAKQRDADTWQQRFTPRRRRSPWSQRNIGIAEGLIAAGRMRPAGHSEIERAKADGRWAAAYAGPAASTVPDDLATALAAVPAALEMFEKLNQRNRYAVLYRLASAKRPDTRARRLEEFVAMLARGDTIYPQRDSTR